jgi:hypothetical protein
MERFKAIKIDEPTSNTIVKRKRINGTIKMLEEMK